MRSIYDPRQSESRDPRGEDLVRGFGTFFGQAKKRQKIYNLHFSFYDLDSDIRYAVFNIHYIEDFRINKNSINSKV